MEVQAVNIANHLPSLADSSRVWIYQAENKLSETEIGFIKQACDKFIPAWKAHGTNLEADYRILFKRFVCLFVDESGQNATGCSIDSSVHFIQELESALGKSLMERTTVIFLDEDQELQEVEMNEMRTAINSETLVFNNLVTSLGDMKNNWLTPAKNSWHARML